MVSVKEVAKLNSRIEKINVERTKAKTKQEILQKKLDEELAEYKEKYEVDLSGDTLKKTKSLIDAEVKKVTKVVEEEYNLKLSIVSAIESGDYAEANRLMGIEEEPEEVVEEEEAESEEVEEQEELVDQEEEEDFADFGFDEDTDVSAKSAEESEEAATVESTEDEEELMTVPKVNAGAKSFLDAVNNKVKPETPKVEDEEEEVKPAKKMISVKEAFANLNVSDLTVEDDDDEEEDDFGFGDMLAGTKFEIEED